jgi:hypothetical protein
MSLLTDRSGYIRYPDSRKGPPANEADLELFAIPTPLLGEVTSGSSLLDVIDVIDTILGNRSPNDARMQSPPNTKDKALKRPRRDDRNVLGMDDGNGMEIGTTVDSNTTSRDHTLSPERTRALSHSPQDLTNKLQGKSRYPVACGGFGDIWRCELMNPDGTVQVRPASPTSYSCNLL